MPRVNWTNPKPWERSRNTANKQKVGPIFSKLIQTLRDVRSDSGQRAAFEYSRLNEDQGVARLLIIVQKVLYIVVIVPHDNTEERSEPTVYVMKNGEVRKEINVPEETAWPAALEQLAMEMLQRSL